ncbi:sperm-associated antigen 5 isoform X2 [Narcine bancroftii]|uniref:sperm-associated antigen 5 isoform X2 n=1 Tax=Narcine bancroftii TaxID=1343680 RepID=UPI0038320858
MFTRQQSVTTSSSENEDQLLSTPGKKCNRAPLQDVLLQCSTHRDMQRSSSKAHHSVGVLSSNLTPLLQGLHLEKAHRPVSLLVYDDTCKTTFVDEEDVCTLPPLQAIPRARGFRETGLLDTEKAETPGCEAPDPLQPQDDHLSLGADAHPVHTGEILRKPQEDPTGEVSTKVQEDPERSINEAVTVDLEQQAPSTPIDTAAGYLQTSAIDASSSVFAITSSCCPGPVAKGSRSSSPSVEVTEGTTGQSRELLSPSPEEPVSTAQDPGSESLDAKPVDLGRSPIAAHVPCALTCLVHPGCMQTPADIWRQLAAEIGTRRVTCREVGTAVTPVGLHCATTSITPVSLAEKDTNTSELENAYCEVSDSAVLTDSLLWNVSRTDMESITRGQLEHRLETALLINEVLSSQLSELSKRKGLHLVVGPADQRETFTQTSNTQAPEMEEHYQVLYLKQVGRLRELELGLEMYQQLHSALIDAQQQQNSLAEEEEEILRTVDGACEEMRSERARMFKLLKEARQLARESTQTLQDTDRAKTRALEEAVALKSQVLEAEWKQINMQLELEQTVDGLREALANVKRLTTENLKLKSDLGSLNKQLVATEGERDKLLKENGRYFVELATAEASLKLSEATLGEKTERLQACEAQSREAGEMEQRLRKEKEDLEEAVLQAQSQVLSLSQALQLKDRELQELSDLRAQAALISDNCEFLEQEIRISRAQLAETEGQLSEQMHSLHQRNLQCEELRAQCNCFQSELETVKKDARGILLEMGQQMNQAIVEIMDMEGRIQSVIRSAETSLKIWQQGLPRTVAEAKAEETLTAPGKEAGGAEDISHPSGGLQHQEEAACAIKSSQSAFTPLKPASTAAADHDNTLEMWLSRLQGALEKLLEVSSLTEDTTELRLQALQHEISKGKEQHEAKCKEKAMELQSLQDRVSELKSENRQLTRDLQGILKERCHLQQALSHRNETIDEFSKHLDSNLEEHKQFLAMKEEVRELKRQLQQVETEANTFREEYAKVQTHDGAPGKDWIQEKVDLRNQVQRLRVAYLQKDEDIQQLKERMIRHRGILEENHQKAEAEVAKLDNLLEYVRQTLQSVPDVVANSVELQGLVQYLGNDLGT